MRGAFQIIPLSAGRGARGEGAKLVSISGSYHRTWKWCAITCLAMMLLSLIPQIHLWIVRGRSWNGAYVSLQGDEIYYSGYVNALMDGRSRKTDPFAGRDDTANSPLPESTFSIQFVPAYVISALARVFGASASTAFIVLTGVAALLASLAVFWLLNSVTANHHLAAAGTLFVLCFGSIAGRYGLFNTFVDIGIPALHFLRRYQPAAAFPLFFVFQLLVWRALTSQITRHTRVFAIVAGLTLAALIFSYLYLWTGAAAWLMCVGALWLCFRPADRRRTTGVLATVVGVTAIALVPYVWLLSHRPPTLDEQQTLVSTHRPDFLRVHEIMGAAILVALAIGIRRYRVARTDRRAIYVASLALLPFVVFNQQVLTGKTMQAFHFEIFVVNYSTLLGLMVLVTFFWNPNSNRLFIWLAALSFSFGFVVVALPSRLIFVPSAIENDKAVPALLRLKELSRQDGTLTALHRTGFASTLVFSPRVPLMALLPTWTTQGTLIDVGGLDFGSSTLEERKIFLYTHLYYSRVDQQALREVLNGTSQKPPEELWSFRSMVFGHERTIRALSFDFKPIQPDEVEREVNAYETFAKSFSRVQAVTRPITYALIPIESNFDFSNLDRWYERDAGEYVGDYILYRLKLRP